MKHVRKLPAFMLLIALMLGIMYPSTFASAKSVDDYDWSGSMQKIFVSGASEAGEIGTDCVYDSLYGETGKWTIGAYTLGNLKDDMNASMEKGNLVFNPDLQGTFKLVLRYGSKFAPLSEKGIGEWGSLDTAVSDAVVLNVRSIPFNFNFAGCTTDEEYKKAIDASDFLVFDKSGKSMFKVPLSDWTGVIDTYGALEEDKSEQEKEKSKVSAEIAGKGGKGLKVKVTWEFASGSTSLSDVMISDLKKELVEGSTSGSKGSCVYEFDIAYNAGKVDCYEVDALHMAHGWYRQDV